MDINGLVIVSRVLEAIVANIKDYVMSRKSSNSVGAIWVNHIKGNLQKEIYSKAEIFILVVHISYFNFQLQETWIFMAWLL